MEKLFVLCMIIVIIAFYCLFFKKTYTSSNNDDLTEIPREMWHCSTNDKNIEPFVAWNNDQYMEGIPTALARDNEILNQLFQEVVADDVNKFDGKQFDDFRVATHFEEEIKGIMHYVLKRINLKGNKGYTGLDFVTASKEQTVDKQTNSIVNKFNFTVFVQEKNKLNVHAHGSLISCQVIQVGDLVKIEKLHTVTDQFYKGNEGPYEGYNKHDELYRLENQFHLHKPWQTNEGPILMDDAKTEELLTQWHKDLKTPGYKCFENIGVNKSPLVGKGFYEDHGSRWKTQTECQQNQGVWDQPVKNSAECPFYRKNLNYPNRLGGKSLQSDQCDMPVGTKTIGYRYLSNDPIHKPWCYNCKIGADGMPGSIGPCCDEQYDKDKYPNLVTPDFAFPSDELERMQFSRELGERGLNWQKHPTAIRDIKNPNQKQPVFNAIIGPGPGPATLPQ